jgi:hypothetical protein
LSTLGPLYRATGRRVHDLLRDLDGHVERENLGIFPVSVHRVGEFVVRSDASCSRYP